MGRKRQKRRKRQKGPLDSFDVLNFFDAFDVFDDQNGYKSVNVGVSYEWHPHFFR